MNERLAELEQVDVVQLTRTKYRSDEIEKVYLQWEAVEEAYRISGRTPLRTKLEQLRASLIPLSSHPWRWIQEWRQEMDDALAQGKTVRLDPDDVQGTVDLVCTLNELPLLGDRAVPIRIFSQQLFRDTKHLERQTLKRLIALAKQASGEQRETEEEWLDWLGLTRNPQSVFLCGSLVFRARDGKQVDISAFPGGLGLSGETIDAITHIFMPARHILTIENWTSYHYYLEQPSVRAGEVLVIYTGGYPNRVLQSFLRKLSQVVSEASNPPELLHWGDIDLGGIRIFKWIQSNFFPGLRPYRMGVDTLLQYESQAAPVSEDYASQLLHALSEPRYADWLPVLETMLERRIRLEQECIVD
ncbi:Wadjet anti-phage system protein JetD domain-containing protein [Paenibacillus sp. MER TA 81-3]|uniref:Wadjet anti-phage system protein JetD domain-containing protein n=1 Tax=Paenibacillus sp. MER TA 81-3 TaxID=2939573 RepID=UPI00203E0A6B|nr:Wadjet anti-phage system protein JetD domain-containing protein [Paenibacillus sp. MER TA 81-3]